MSAPLRHTSRTTASARSSVSSPAASVGSSVSDSIVDPRAPAVRLVLASLHLSWLGGATTYLITIPPALTRLGHEGTLYSPDAAESQGIGRPRGGEVVTSETRLPDDCDAVLTQDTVMCAELGALLEAPQVFVMHGAEMDMAAPPPGDGARAAAVAMNDRVMARLETQAAAIEPVRLRQPIDMDQFK